MTKEKKRVWFYYRPNGYQLSLAEEALIKEEGSETLQRHKGTALFGALLVGIASVLLPGFPTSQNMVGLLANTVFFFMLAAPLTCLMTTGECDLSIGAVAGFGCVTAAIVSGMGFPVPVSLAAGLITGILWGAAKAVFLSKTGLPSAVVTLGMQCIIGSLVSMAGGRGWDWGGRIYLNSWLFPLILAGIEGIFLHRLLTKPWFGSETDGVKRLRFCLHILVSVMAALGGSCEIPGGFGDLQNAMANNIMTLLFSLELWSAVVMGGTSMTGGRGTIAGTLAGCFVIAAIDKAVFIQGSAGIGWQNLLLGSMVAGAAFWNRYRPGTGRTKESRRFFLPVGAVALFACLIILAGGRGERAQDENPAVLTKETEAKQVGKAETADDLRTDEDSSRVAKSRIETKAPESETSQPVRVLTMATNAEYPPYEYYDGSSITGIDVEVAEAIAQKLGMTLEVKDTSFDAILPLLGEGGADIAVAAMTATEDRSRLADFTDPYASVCKVVLVREDSVVLNLEELYFEADEVGILVAPGGDIYQSVGDFPVETFEAYGCGIENYEKGSEAISDLLQGRLGAVIMDLDLFAVYADKYEGIRMLDEPLFEDRYAIAVKKGNVELLERVNEALKELRESGKIQTIIKKYIRAE